MIFENGILQKRASVVDEKFFFNSNKLSSSTRKALAQLNLIEHLNGLPKSKSGKAIGLSVPESLGAISDRTLKLLEACCEPGTVMYNGLPFSAVGAEDDPEASFEISLKSWKRLLKLANPNSKINLEKMTFKHNKGYLEAVKHPYAFSFTTGALVSLSETKLRTENTLDFSNCVKRDDASEPHGFGLGDIEVLKVLATPRTVVFSENIINPITSLFYVADVLRLKKPESALDLQNFGHIIPHERDAIDQVRACSFDGCTVDGNFLRQVWPTDDPNAFAAATCKIWSYNPQLLWLKTAKWPKFADVNILVENNPSDAHHSPHIDHEDISDFLNFLPDSSKVDLSWLKLSTRGKDWTQDAFNNLIYSKKILPGKGPSISWVCPNFPMSFRQFTDMTKFCDGRYSLHSIQLDATEVPGIEGYNLDEIKGLNQTKLVATDFESSSLKTFMRWAKPNTLRPDFFDELPSKSFDDEWVDLYIEKTDFSQLKPGPSYPGQSKSSGRPKLLGLIQNKTLQVDTFKKLISLDSGGQRKRFEKMTFKGEVSFEGNDTLSLKGVTMDLMSFRSLMRCVKPGSLNMKGLIIDDKCVGRMGKDDLLALKKASKTPDSSYDVCLKNVYFEKDMFNALAPFILSGNSIQAFAEIVPRPVPPKLSLPLIAPVEIQDIFISSLREVYGSGNVPFHYDETHIPGCSLREAYLADCIDLAKPGTFVVRQLECEDMMHGSSICSKIPNLFQKIKFRPVGFSTQLFSAFERYKASFKDICELTYSVAYTKSKSPEYLQHLKVDMSDFVFSSPETVDGDGNLSFQKHDFTGLSFEGMSLSMDNLSQLSTMAKPGTLDLTGALLPGRMLHDVCVTLLRTLSPTCQSLSFSRDRVEITGVSLKAPDDLNTLLLFRDHFAENQQLRIKRLEEAPVQQAWPEEAFGFDDAYRKMAVSIEVLGQLATLSEAQGVDFEGLQCALSIPGSKPGKKRILFVDVSETGLSNMFRNWVSSIEKDPESESATDVDCFGQFPEALLTMLKEMSVEENPELSRENGIKYLLKAFLKAASTLEAKHLLKLVPNSIDLMRYALNLEDKTLSTCVETIMTNLSTYKPESDEDKASFALTHESLLSLIEMAKVSDAYVPMVCNLIKAKLDYLKADPQQVLLFNQNSKIYESISRFVGLIANSAHSELSPDSVFVQDMLSTMMLADPPPNDRSVVTNASQSGLFDHYCQLSIRFDQAKLSPIKDKLTEMVGMYEAHLPEQFLALITDMFVSVSSAPKLLKNLEFCTGFLALLSSFTAEGQCRLTASELTEELVTAYVRIKAQFLPGTVQKLEDILSKIGLFDVLVASGRVDCVGISSLNVITEEMRRYETKLASLKGEQLDREQRLLTIFRTKLVAKFGFFLQFSDDDKGFIRSPIDPLAGEINRILENTPDEVLSHEARTSQKYKAGLGQMLKSVKDQVESESDEGVVKSWFLDIRKLVSDYWKSQGATFNENFESFMPFALKQSKKSPGNQVVLIDIKQVLALFYAVDARPVVPEIVSSAKQWSDEGADLKDISPDQLKQIPVLSTLITLPGEELKWPLLDAMFDSPKVESSIRDKHKALFSEVWGAFRPSDEDIKYVAFTNRVLYDEALGSDQFQEVVFEKGRQRLEELTAILSAHLKPLKHPKEITVDTFNDLKSGVIKTKLKKGHIKKICNASKPTSKKEKLFQLLAMAYIICKFTSADVLGTASHSPDSLRAYAGGLLSKAMRLNNKLRCVDAKNLEDCRDSLYADVCTQEVSRSIFSCVNAYKNTLPEDDMRQLVEKWGDYVPGDPMHWDKLSMSV